MAARRSGQGRLPVLRSKPAMRSIAAGAMLWLALCGAGHADESDRDDHEVEGRVIAMTIAQRLEAGIATRPVAHQALVETRRLPAEVTVNAYRSSRVTPRIPAQIVSRHVRLGDEVAPGQRLVTLSSVEMAEAQGRLIVTDREWRLVRELGEQAVSARRYGEAEVARQQALARVLAYGMTEAQARHLLQSGDVGAAVGAFDLIAPQAGTIVSDEFMAGELIDPGRMLFEIVDESIVWVDARTAGGELPDVHPGMPVRILAQDIRLPGRVVGQQHRLDETTRTQGMKTMFCIPGSSWKSRCRSAKNAGPWRCRTRR